MFKKNFLVTVMSLMLLGVPFTGFADPMRINISNQGMPSSPGSNTPPGTVVNSGDRVQATISGQSQTSPKAFGPQSHEPKVKKSQALSAF